MVEAIGYAAFALNVAGNLMLARMNVWGWIVRLVTNVAWIAYAVQIPGGGPMWMNHAAFFAINIYGFREWRRQPTPCLPDFDPQKEISPGFDDRFEKLLAALKPYPCPKCGGDMDLVTLDHIVCEDCGHDLGGGDDQPKGLE